MTTLSYVLSQRPADCAAVLRGGILAPLMRSLDASGAPADGLTELADGADQEASDYRQVRVPYRRGQGRPVLHSGAKHSVRSFLCWHRGKRSAPRRSLPPAGGPLSPRQPGCAPGDVVRGVWGGWAEGAARRACGCARRAVYRGQGVAGKRRGLLLQSLRLVLSERCLQMLCRESSVCSLDVRMLADGRPFLMLAGRGVGAAAEAGCSHGHTSAVFRAGSCERSCVGGPFRGG
jgi:hypothetical protein